MTNKDKVILIDKAISEADLLFIEGSLVRPSDHDGVGVFYQEVYSGEMFWADINDLKEVKSYEEGNKCEH
jgi:hypothetical protein